MKKIGGHGALPRHRAGTDAASLKVSMKSRRAFDGWFAGVQIRLLVAASCCVTHWQYMSDDVTECNIILPVFTFRPNSHRSRLQIPAQILTNH